MAAFKLDYPVITGIDRINAGKAGSMIEGTAPRPAQPKKKAKLSLPVVKKKKAKHPKETDPLALYLKQISRYPLLTAEDELQIGENIQALRAHVGESEAGGSGRESALRELIEVKNRMISSNLRLVVSIAKNYQHRGLASSISSMKAT